MCNFADEWSTISSQSGVQIKIPTSPNPELCQAIRLSWLTWRYTAIPLNELITRETAAPSNRFLSFKHTKILSWTSLPWTCVTAIVLAASKVVNGGFEAHRTGRRLCRDGFQQDEGWLIVLLAGHVENDINLSNTSSTAQYLFLTRKCGNRH